MQDQHTWSTVMRRPGQIATERSIISLKCSHTDLLQNARNAVLQNIEHTCPFVYTSDQRLLATLIGGPKGDPIKRLIRDGVLSEKHTQLGRMFLHVA